jgi:hypothetical protein
MRLFAATLAATGVAFLGVTGPASADGPAGARYAVGYASDSALHALGARGG